MKWDGCYVGLVKDRLEDSIVYQSKSVMTWDEAQKRANRKAKSFGATNRYCVMVVDSYYEK